MKEKKSKQRFFIALAKEPFIQFMVFGLLIFAVSGWVKNYRQTQARTIYIDAKLQTYLKNLYNTQFGYNPSPDVLEKLIENYIKEEVLFREALKLDLAKQDEIVRRRLVQKMEYLMLDSEVRIETPDKTLRNWYKNHLANYQQQARVSFKHIYFQDNKNDSAIERALLALAQGDKEHVIGDNFPLNSEYTALTPKEALQLFGHSEFSEKLFTAHEGQWAGPWRSGYGLHLVYIENRSEAKTRNFEQVKAKVFSDWQKDDQQKRFVMALREREKTYTIMREPAEVPSGNTQAGLQ